VPISRSLDVCPAVFKTKMQCYKQINGTSVTTEMVNILDLSTAGQHVIVNDLSQPWNNVAANEQPRHFDRYRALYDAYKVTGLKVEAWVELRPTTGTDSTFNAYAYLGPAIRNLVPSNLKYIMEDSSRRYKVKHFRPNTAYQGDATGIVMYQNQVAYIKMYLPPWKWYSIKKQRYLIGDINGDVYTSIDNNEPGVAMDGVILGCGVASAGGNATVNAQVRLTYYVTWSDRKSDATGL